MSSAGPRTIAQVGEGAHETCLLDQRQEHVGVAQALLRVPPTDQRLDAVHRTRGQRRLRLVVQHDVVAEHRDPQLLDGLQPLVGGGGGAAVVGGVRSPLRLGLVQRDIGALQQPVDVDGVLRAQGDPDAAVDVQSHLVQLERLPQRVEQPIRDGLCVRGVRTGKQQGELVAAQPGEHVALPQHPLDARADLAEELVAHVVSEAVVDLLEAVQVQDQQRQAAHRRGARPEQGLRHLVQRTAVGQAGERIGARLHAALGQGPDLQEGEHHPQGPDGQGGEGQPADRRRQVQEGVQGGDQTAEEHPADGDDQGSHARQLSSTPVDGGARQRRPGAQRHKQEADRPQGIDPPPLHVAAVGELDQVDRVDEGEDQKPRAHQQRSSAGPPAEHGGAAQQEGDKQQVQDRVGQVHRDGRERTAQGAEHRPEQKGAGGGGGA